jgi:lanosterol synthase
LTTALDRAAAHLLALQQDRGCWEGEMVWCPVILAQHVIVQRVVGRAPDAATRAGMRRHFEVTRTADGAWGLHPEAPGSVFVTTLGYVALRLLGLPPDDPMTGTARRWLRAQTGGVLAIPTWGKLWLALLGLYDYRGVNPCPPELLLLPRWVAIHPRRYYCHTRHIYLGLSYLYGRRVRASLGPITEELFRELYELPREQVDFGAHRHVVSATDLRGRPGWFARRLTDLLALYERIAPETLRRRALADGLARILYEQRQSGHQALSPVNGLLNCLAIWAHDPAHPYLAASLEGIEAWRWEDPEAGVRYAGARSHTWDTAFAAQALLDMPASSPGGTAALRRAYRFLASAQLADELPDLQRADRDPVQGGWCFSDGAHRWPVSDCTAEALGAVLRIHDVPGLIAPRDQIPVERVRQAALFILARQNPDGGFGTYERRRGSPLLDALNPSEMFRDCMTERSYVECTGSAIAALARFRRAYPGELADPVGRAIERGVRFLRIAQRPDGSWAGFWGINFTYAAFHAVRGLRAAGVDARDSGLTRAADWLCRAQRADGGWGEHHSGCLEGRYVEHKESQAVMTSWALLALMDVVEPDAAPVRRGVAWLAAAQRPDGSWPRQAVNGVFFGSAMLDYQLYRSYFPAWALARHAATGG